MSDGGGETGVTVELHLAPEQYLDYYRGHAQQVRARAVDGRVILFPASALQRFVQPDGIHGWFRIQFDAGYRLRGVERVSAPGEGGH